MKILYVVHSYYPEETGGAGKSVQMLAEAMVREGHSVSVVCLTEEKERKTYDHNDVTVYALPIRNIYYPHVKKARPAWQRFIFHAIDIFNPWAMYDFDKVLQEVKPDIVNTNTLAGFSTSLLYAVKFRKIKLVHTMRDYYLMCPQSGMYRADKNCNKICPSCKPFAFMRKQASKNVDVFLGNSQFVVDRHLQHKMFPAKALHYCQWNMNDSDDIGSPKTIESHAKIRFGFIGNINVLKGTDILIESCKALTTSDWSLTVAGSGKEDFMTYLKEMAPHNVAFIGWTSAPEFYQSIDILICPSTYHDPLPRVIYEAYQQGVPVIASDTGGNPEIVDDGKTGFLYPAKSILKLTDILDRCTLLSPNEYAAMSKAALEKAKLFTPESILEDYKQKVL